MDLKDQEDLIREAKEGEREAKEEVKKARLSFCCCWRVRENAD